jgi:DNA polymerase III alpha subunit
MVYQEDVIKVAMHFGGVSAANGDVLRRAMSGKGRSLSALQKLKDDFLNRVKEKVILTSSLRKFTDKLNLSPDIRSVKHIQLPMRWKVIKVYI